MPQGTTRTQPASLSFLFASLFLLSLSPAPFILSARLSVRPSANILLLLLRLLTSPL